MEDIVSEYHIPVLYRECIDNLVINKDGVYLDCTLGGGGHSEGILKELSEKGHLISIDQDQQAIDFAKKRLEKYGKKWQVFKNNFENLDMVLYMAGYDKVDGILMDIGVSSTQLDDPERGFSYRYDTRLDMRMNRSNPLSAYEVVNEYPEERLAKIIFEYGEERNARKIAKFICEARAEKNIETTGELVAIIKRAYPERAQKHPAKKTFQAIRIAVNDELGALEESLEQALDLLNPGGRISVITFQSLEDRLVKVMFKQKTSLPELPPGLPVIPDSQKVEYKLITRKPIVPSEDEITHNNRAHSAKLRIIEKL